MVAILTLAAEYDLHSYTEPSAPKLQRQSGRKRENPPLRLAATAEDLIVTFFIQEDERIGARNPAERHRLNPRSAARAMLMIPAAIDQGEACFIIGSALV
jgi:hypothetical protein